MLGGVVGSVLIARKITRPLLCHLMTGGGSVWRLIESVLRDLLTVFRVIGGQTNRAITSDSGAGGPHRGTLVVRSRKSIAYTTDGGSLGGSAAVTLKRPRGA